MATTTKQKIKIAFSHEKVFLICNFSLVNMFKYRPFQKQSLSTKEYVKQPTLINYRNFCFIRFSKISFLVPEDLLCW
jgi:hypothetical protein